MINPDWKKNGVSGYSIYNLEQKNRRKVQPLPDVYLPLPAKKYDIIYADPPWDYGGKMQFDKTSIKTENVGFKRDIFISSAEFKYPTLKLEQLAQILVPEICKDDCLLFLWTTSPHLDQSLELGKMWGFKYRTVAFIWDKMVHNPGKYTLSNCELCLVFKSGRIPLPRGARNIQQLVRSPRKDHSQKPDEVRQNIEAMWPTQDRIELFARKNSKGWDTWGLDIAEGMELARTTGTAC